MIYGRQQVLWQKQVTVIGSIDLGSQIEEYHTGVAQFQHIICHRRAERRQRFTALSFFVAAVDHSVKLLGVANVIAFLYKQTHFENTTQNSSNRDYENKNTWKKLEGARERAYLNQVNFYRIVIFKGSCPDCPWEHACQIWSHLL